MTGRIKEYAYKIALEACATDITLSNDEDGMAIYLENYLKTAKLT